MFSHIFQQQKFWSRSFNKKSNNTQKTLEKNFTKIRLILEGLYSIVNFNPIVVEYYSNFCQNFFSKMFFGDYHFFVER